LLNESVSAIRPQEQKIQLADRSIGYDHLVLATGSNPRHLPASIGGALPGVYVARNLQDVDGMAPEFTAGRHVLIIGGGYIGLEAAAVAALKGLRVTLVEMADRILQRVASAQTSDYFRSLHQSHGVNIIEGTGLKNLVGSDRVTGAILNDGTELDVDFAIVGVGITPANDLAQSAGITIANGISTDAMGQTSVANIWAAGDCASFPYRGGRIRLESVPNAIEQAEVVAQNIMGAGLEYQAKPWFWSDQYDVKLQIAGLNSGYDDVVTRPSGNEAMVSYWYYRKAELLAVDAMNDPRSYMVGKRLIEMGKSPSKQAVADPDTDLKSLLK